MPRGIASLRILLRLTFRAFTKPRSRPQGGGGVSTPAEICYFHGLRGKRATRALREMSLLGAVGTLVAQRGLLLFAEVVGINSLDRVGRS